MTNRKQPESRPCIRCGTMFSPINIRTGALTAKRYCSDPKCEIARKRENEAAYTARRKEKGK